MKDEEKRGAEAAEVEACDDASQIMKIRTNGRRCRLKARCAAAGACNDVTFISLIMDTERGILRPGAGTTIT